MLGEGVTYVDSWVDLRMERCFQLMEAVDRSCLDAWIARWEDLVDCEVFEVMTSAAARQAAMGRSPEVGRVSKRSQDRAPVKSLSWRFAGENEVPLLAELNHRLIRDEGHRNPMDVAELADRMAGWLESNYRAVLFEKDGKVVAYALYRPSDDGWEASRGVYLRQFFVCRDQRRRGIGAAAFDLLRAEVWPPHCRITLETLLHNQAAREFWQAIGFREHSVAFEWREQSDDG